MGQRLVNSEIDNRVDVRLDKSIKRVDDGVHGLMTFGQENDYPQVMEKLIGGSPTAKAASKTYSKFLTGAGFEKEEINDIVIGQDARGKEVTILSLLREVSGSIANNNGFYLYCAENIDDNGNPIVTSANLKSFKTVRFAKPDDEGYSAKLLVSEQWGERRFDKRKIKEFNIFNLNEKAFSAQVKAADEKNEKFKGQIYFQFLDNQFFYPLSPFDPAYLDCDTEAQIALFKNRQLRNGFFDKVVFSIAPDGDESEKREYADKVKSLMGADGDSCLILETDTEENGGIDQNAAIKIDTIKSNVNDKLFDNWENGLSNNIRKSANNVPKLLMDIEDGIFSGQSGESIKQATNFFNAMTKDDRALISRSFEEVFKHFDNDKLKNNTNWEIKPLTLIEDGIIDDRTATIN